MSMKPSQTIGNVKEAISAEEGIPIERLDAWSIEYKNGSSQCNIRDEKTLGQYMNNDKIISTVFVTESGFEPSSKTLGTLSCRLVKF